VRAVSETLLECWWACVEKEHEARKRKLEEQQVGDMQADEAN